MERSPRTADLFWPPNNDAPRAALGAGVEAGRPDGEAIGGAVRGSSQESTSVAWYAAKQAELYRAGLESASAFWKAQGVKWTLDAPIVDKETGA
jgi:hypothetical protein